MTAWVDIALSQSARVRELDAWWRQKAGGRRLPDRADLDPVELPQLLPYMLISEVEHPFRVRYRLIGTEVVHITGLNFTGHYLDQLIPPGDEESWMAHYRQCYETAQPIYGLSTVKTLAGGSFGYEYGIWPLTKGGNDVSQFIALEDYGPHKARARALLDQAKLWRRAVLANESGATAVEYALIGCFIALAVLIGVSLSGNGLNKIFAVTGDRVMNAANAANQTPN